jgi:flagellar capping protein FliD
MFMTFLSLLGANRWLQYIVIGIALTAGLTATYYIWKHSIEQQVLLEYNARQLEQVVREREEFQRRQEQLDYQQRTLQRQLATQNNELRRRFDEIQATINQAEDRPASEVLRRTIEQLREIQ